jgi:hypothetical protein
LWFFVIHKRWKGVEGELRADYIPVHWPILIYQNFTKSSEKESSTAILEF